jgi:hypothetical protein
MTSIEWLINAMENPHKNINWEDAKQQAKEMHKQEIMNAQSYAISHADMTNNKGYFDCEKYYQETFKID